MEPAIEIHDLGKQYALKNNEPYLSLRDSLSNFGRKIFRKSSARETFWALQNIDLTIQPGERIGIIGRNGAGKSTLLKIISRITPPTTGHATIRGRVGSLLEVGTGFHPELTGLENIYLNGSILGLKKSDITRQLEAIIDFSGIERFISTPLKHYSTGMQLRLAFSVAAHLEPEILLIDEVLAVGDAEFQKKCLGKMEEVSNQAGRTIVFVSHDLSAVSTLTSSCLFLNEGKCVAFGTTDQMIKLYANSSSNAFEIAASSGRPTISKVEINTSEQGNLQTHGKPLSISFEITMPKRGYENVSLSFQVFNKLNQPVLFHWINDRDKNICREAGKNILKFHYDSLWLYKGNYYLRVHFANSKTREKFQEFDCCNFSVEMIGLKEPEWGWTDGVCQVIHEGNWEV